MAILRLYVCKRRKIICKEPGGTADFSRSIESVWYGFSGINKKAAPPWGRNFGTQKRLICAASIRSKMAAASRAKPPSMSSAARDRLSPMVEQAPYSP